MHLSTFTVCVGATLLFAFLVLLAGHQLGGVGMLASSCVPSMPLASVVATLGGRGGSSPPPGSGTVSTGVGDSPTLPELGSLVTIGSFSVASPSLLRQTDKWLGKWL